MPDSIRKDGAHQPRNLQEISKAKQVNESMKDLEP